MIYLLRWQKVKSKTLIVAFHEFSKTVRRKGFLFATFGLPVILILIFGIAFSQMPALIEGSEEQKGFVDHSGLLSSAEDFIAYPDEALARKGVRNGDISSFFVLQDDFTDTGEITVYSTKSSVGNRDTGNIGTFIRKNLVDSSGLPQAIAERIIDPVGTADFIELDDEGNIADEKSPGEFIVPVVLAFMLVFSIMTSSGYLMQGIGEEKESRSGEMLLSSISAEQLLGGKILGYGGVGLMQMGVWIFMTFLIILLSPFSGIISDIGLSWVLMLVIIYFILGYFLFSISIACTAAVSTTIAEAQQNSMIFTMFAIIPLILFQFIITAPKSPVFTFLTYFPYTTPFITIFRLAVGEVSSFEIAAGFVILIISIFIALILSAKIFRLGMLLTGKKAGFLDIIRYLKE